MGEEGWKREGTSLLCVHARFVVCVSNFASLIIYKYLCGGKGEDGGTGERRKRNAGLKCR